MSDTFHFHEFTDQISFPNGQFVNICSICGKTKETLVDERIESIEGAISELNDAMMKFARDTQVLGLKFKAFVDMVVAYSSGVTEDLDAFQKLGEGRADEVQTDAGDIPDGS